MNEQEMILNKKIEKREKFDTILAYILLVILLGCILGVLYLKFIRVGDDNEQEEYIPNYISLNDISNSLNNSILANTYKSENVNFNSSVSDNIINANYIKDDINFDFDISVVGNELMITMNEENNDIINDVYKEIASIICVYYGNNEKNCKYTLDNMDENGIDGIRVVNTDNNKIIYIATTRSYAVIDKIVYNSVTMVELTDTNYTLEIFDTRISNISLVYSNSSIKLGGNIERLIDDKSNISILVKLYDKDGNVLTESKYEYNEDNVLDSYSDFNIEILFDETLKLNDVSKYSIEIVK